MYGRQAYDSIVSGYFRTGFINFMLKGKSSLDNTNLFFPNKYKENDKIKLRYIQ